MEKTDLLLSSSSDRDWDHHRLHHQRRLRTPNETARKGWGSLFIPDVVLAYITYGILHDDADVLEDEDDDGIATESETAR